MVLRYTDYAICRQLCSPSARSSSITVCRYAKVGPLGSAQVAVDVAEQGGGRAETVPVRGSGSLARLHILARNTEFAVTSLAEGSSALAVRGLQRGRGHLVFPLVPRVARGHPPASEALQPGPRRAGYHLG